MIKNIGIIGRGFVGSAVAFGFGHGCGADYNIYIFDKDPKKSENSLEEVITSSDVIFVSVPTPSRVDGSIDLTIVDNCLEEINLELTKTSNNPIVLLRSTIVPGTTANYQKKYPDLRLVFNPEFLTERSANFDFINQTRFILGGKKDNTQEVAELFKQRFGESMPVIETDFSSAELIKYVANIYFATKVSFLNEMKLISDKVNADWDTVIDGFLRDGRVGHSHCQVPGPDGKNGYGGSCFPKDVQALIHFSKEIGVNLNVVEGSWQTNLEVRPERDWEKLKGRAVSDT